MLIKEFVTYARSLGLNITAERVRQIARKNIRNRVKFSPMVLPAEFVELLIQYLKIKQKIKGV